MEIKLPDRYLNFHTGSLKKYATLILKCKYIVLQKYQKVSFSKC